MIERNLSIYMCVERPASLLLCRSSFSASFPSSLPSSGSPSRCLPLTLNHSTGMCSHAGAGVMRSRGSRDCLFCHAGQLRPASQKTAFLQASLGKTKSRPQGKFFFALIIIIKRQHVARAARDINVAGGAAIEWRIGIRSRSSMKAFFAHQNHDAGGERSAA